MFKKLKRWIIKKLGGYTEYRKEGNNESRIYK